MALDKYLYTPKVKINDSFIPLVLPISTIDLLQTKLNEKQNLITLANKLSNTLISGLGTASTVNTGTSAGNVPVLDSNGKLSSLVIPASAITDTFVVSSQAEMLALTAQVGDVAVRTDLNKSFILKTEPATVLANWQELLTPTDSVQSVNGKTGVVTLTYTDVNALSDTTTLADLSDDATHRLVTDTEKATWNAKQDAGNYVTTDTSQHITNDKYFDDNKYLYFGTNGRGGKIYGTNYSLIIQNPYQQNIDVLVGSTKGIAISATQFRPKVNNNMDLGNSSYEWKDLYLAGNVTDGTNAISVANIVGKQNALTSTQLDAVNSGINSSGVSQITTNQTNISELDTIKVEYSEGADLSAFSWSEIADVSASGNAANVFSIGDTKNITLSTDETITLMIVGFNHDTITGTNNTAGITFAVKNGFNTLMKMNDTRTSDGGWGDTALRATLNSTIYNTLPSDLKSVIKSVDKKYYDGYTYGSTLELKTASDKLFLFSAGELGDNRYTDEGSIYTYFNATENRIMYKDGSATSWWNRTHYTTYPIHAFWITKTNGDVGVANGYADNPYLVVAGFCV